MVPFFVTKRTDKECEQSISNGQQIYCKRWELSVYNGNPEIFDIDVYGIEIEKLGVITKVIYTVENSRHIHKEHNEYTPKILHITEEYEQCREYESHAEVENYKAYNGYQKGK